MNIRSCAFRSCELGNFSPRTVHERIPNSVPYVVALQQVRTTNGALTEHFEEVSPDMHTTAEVTRSEVSFPGDRALESTDNPAAGSMHCENTQRISEKS